MNTITGWTGELPSDLYAAPGERLDPSFPAYGPVLEDHIEQRPEGEEKEAELGKLRALQEQVATGDPIVAVSGEVVQRLRLGDRELRRRRQRR